MTNQRTERIEQVKAILLDVANTAGRDGITDFGIACCASDIMAIFDPNYGTCPKCGSYHVKRKGFSWFVKKDGTRIQVFQCTDCGKQTFHPNKTQLDKGLLALNDTEGKILEE